MSIYIIISVIFFVIFDALMENIIQHNILGFIDIYLSKILNKEIKWFGNNASENKYKLKPIWLWSTILVCFTDSWHFIKYLRNYCLFTSLGYALDNDDFHALYYALLGIGIYVLLFEFVYSHIKTIGIIMNK